MDWAAALAPKRNAFACELIAVENVRPNDVAIGAMLSDPGQRFPGGFLFPMVVDSDPTHLRADCRSTT